MIIMDIGMSKRIIDSGVKDINGFIDFIGFV